TTPHSTTGETPFRLTYGTETVIPVETGASSFRTEIPLLGEENQEALREELDLLEELRDGEESSRQRNAIALVHAGRTPARDGIFTPRGGKLNDSPSPRFEFG
ncbi:hypothetical protein A2U01_0000330, partial [Trifolium medium]|nr:hypothetical protein [Trifolium medium]